MLLRPNGDTLITMARKVYEASDLNFCNFSFSTSPENLQIFVYQHDDVAGTQEHYETVTLAELVAAYIGLSLTLDLDANDAVTTGHRLGNTGRVGAIKCGYAKQS